MQDVISEKVNIGERLFEERKRLNLSQTEMSKLCGVALSTYHTYEKGTRAPDAESLVGLFRAGGDVLYILTGTRNQMALSNVETVLLEGFNRMDERGKAVVQAVVQTYNTTG